MYLFQKSLNLSKIISIKNEFHLIPQLSATNLGGAQVAHVPPLNFKQQKLFAIPIKR